jgi:Na+-translocating ferredoxin:NAD+ oxidoreductase RNF subunit RnfB
MAILIPTLVISALGLVFGLLLGYAGKKFAVEVDERLNEVRNLLPGANCSGCGYPSCDAFAAALNSGKADVTSCAVNKAENRKLLSALLGTEDVEIEPSSANVICQGELRNCPPRLSYEGLTTCAAAHKFVPGLKGCEQACLGLGDCVRVCAFGAIVIEDNIAKIDPKKCTACGTCVKACPRSVIRLLPRGEKAAVLCRTTLPPRQARQICQTACIKCLICVKNCPEKAISEQNGQIVVDPHLCKGHGICAVKCPTKAIVLKNTSA